MTGNISSGRNLFASESLLERLQDESNSTTLSKSQQEMDQLVSGASTQLSDWKGLASMMVGGFGYHLGKTTFVKFVGSSFMKAMAPVVGLATEVTFFEGSKALMNQGPTRLDSSVGPSFMKDWLHSFINFGILKSFGHLAQGQNVILQHSVQSLGMVAGEHALYQLKMGAKPEGTLLDQLARAEFTNLQLGVSMSLAHHLMGHRLISIEKSLEIQSSPSPLVGEGWGEGALAIPRPLLMTAEGGLPVGLPIFSMMSELSSIGHVEMATTKKVNGKNPTSDPPPADPISELNQILQTGIKTREHDQRFWELAQDLSPTMKAMAEVLKDCPKDVAFIYPNEEVGYVERSADSLLGRRSEWGSELALGGGVNPLVSVHERTHLIPADKLEGILPKLEFPEISKDDGVVQIAYKIAQHMFMDEALSGLSEVFVANDLVMAGAHSRHFDPRVWEMKAVYDAGGLEAYLKSRLYLGDNHKLQYPIAIAFQMAQKLKSNGKVDDVSIRDLSGFSLKDIDPVAIAKLVAEHAEEIQKQFEGYLNSDPLKYVGDAKKFEEQPEEMRNAALILGALTQRFMPLIEKAEDAKTVHEILKHSMPLLVRMSGDRLSEIIGLMVRRAESLYEKVKSEQQSEEQSKEYKAAESLLDFVCESAAQIFTFKDYALQAQSFVEKINSRKESAERGGEIKIQIVPEGLAPHSTQKIKSTFDSWIDFLDQIRDQQNISSMEFLKKIAACLEIIDQTITQDGLERSWIENGFRQLIELSLMTIDIYDQRFSTYHPTIEEIQLLQRILLGTQGLTRLGLTQNELTDFSEYRGRRLTFDRGQSINFMRDMSLNFLVRFNQISWDALIFRFDARPHEIDSLETLILKSDFQWGNRIESHFLNAYKIVCRRFGRPMHQKIIGIEKSKNNDESLYFNLADYSFLEFLKKPRSPLSAEEQTQLKDFLDAAWKGLDHYQPMASIDDVHNLILKLRGRDAFDLELEALSLAVEYSILGIEQNPGELDQSLSLLTMSKIPHHEIDKTLEQIVQDMVPEWKKEDEDWGIWQSRLENIQVLAPHVIKPEYPLARRLLLERLASYTNPKEQKFELLPTDVYTEVIDALVTPLIRLHPELGEPGFYESFEKLKPTEDVERAQSYSQGLASLFPDKVKRLNHADDMIHWDASLIEAGSMDAFAVEKKVLEELNANLSNKKYPADRLKKLEEVLGALIRYRVFEYVRDTDAKPTEVDYRDEELQEIPLVNYLFFALDAKEAKEAYAQSKETAFAKDLKLKAIGLWDFLEEEVDSLNPIQQVVFRALLKSQHRSEALAKLPIYRQLIGFESLEVEHQKLIFEGLKQAGKVSPYLSEQFEKAQRAPKEMKWFMEATFNFFAITGDELPSDFTFSHLLRSKEQGQEKLFWERYARMWKGFKKTDQFLQKENEKRAALKTEPIKEIDRLELLIHRGVFNTPDSTLDLSNPIDLGLIHDFMLHHRVTSFPDVGNWALNHLHQNAKQHDATTVLTLHVLEALQPQIMLKRDLQREVPWFDVGGLQDKLGRDKNKWEGHQNQITQARLNLLKDREQILKSMATDLPKTFEDQPELVRFFLTESWAQMNATERARRKEVLEKLAATEKPAVVMREYLKMEGLEKLGQIVHMLHGVVPEEWRETFGQTLQDNQSASPYEIREQVNRALGHPLEDDYSHFEMTPEGVGTIAQVHAAHRKDGTAVGVKVVAPSREAKVDQGMKRLETATAWYSLQPERFSTPIDLVAFSKWFKTSMKPEFDLRIEAKNTERYRQEAQALGIDLRTTQVHVGKEKIIEMFWIAADPSKENPETIRKVIHGVVSMLLLKGLVHDDPHRGNIRAGHLLDFGRMEELSVDERKKFADFISKLGFAHLNPEMAPLLLESFEALAEKKMNLDQRAKFQQFLESDAFKAHPLDGTLLNLVIAQGGQAGLTLGPRGYVVIKTLVALDSLGKSVDPQFKLSEVLTEVLMNFYK